MSSSTETIYMYRSFFFIANFDQYNSNAHVDYLCHTLLSTILTEMPSWVINFNTYGYIQILCSLDSVVNAFTIKRSDRIEQEDTDIGTASYVQPFASLLLCVLRHSRYYGIKKLQLKRKTPEFAFFTKIDICF